MAKGDAVVGALTSVAASASLTIQPASGVVWLLKSIVYGGQVEIYVTDGTNSILIDSDGAAGQKININFLLSNTKYVTVKNVGSSAVYIGYDALVWA